MGNPFFLLPGNLSIKVRPETISGTGNPSFVRFRQPHLKGYAATVVSFNAKEENEKAGLLIFQSEYHYYYLCKSIRDGKPVVQLLKGPGNENKKAEPKLIAEHSINKKNKKAILFKIEVLDDKYHFYYALNKKEWILLKADVDAKFLSTKTAGGFVGCFYALYATSEGKSSTNTAQYQWFESRSNDDVYKPK